MEIGGEPDTEEIACGTTGQASCSEVSDIRDRTARDASVRTNRNEPNRNIDECIHYTQNSRSSRDTRRATDSNGSSSEFNERADSVLKSARSDEAVNAPSPPADFKTESATHCSSALLARSTIFLLRSQIIGQIGRNTWVDVKKCRGILILVSKCGNSVFSHALHLVKNSHGGVRCGRR